MPKKLEAQLKREARAKGYKPGTERYNRYVYGTVYKVEKAKLKRMKKAQKRAQRKP